jgi:alpha-ketoglutarate-dependent taurine dioxygenase
MPTTSDASANKTADLSIEPLSDLMGASVTGLDLAKPLNKATQAAVLDAFLKHQLLVFRDQSLTKDEQVAFSLQFGELERHTLRNRGGNDHPLVHIVTNMNDKGAPSGIVKSTQWHSDKSFRPAPSMATILHAINLPPDGGDTCFANMYTAYDMLKDDEKSDLDGLNVIHSWELSRENIGRNMSQAEKDDAPAMSHPLARKHPDTGRIALFIGTHASHIEDAPMDIGRKRIEALEAHATQPKFVYRHQWRSGDVLMWDNRCLLHRADPNFDAATHPRLLHRTCLRGAPTA